jgi:outer membrane protein assembly factor BamA
MLATCLALSLLLSLNASRVEGRFDSVRQQRAAQQESAPEHWTRGRFNEIEGLTVRRVEFSGNTYTRDAPVRRALGLNEGDPFNLKQLKRGLWRVNRLGYFKRVTTNDVEWLILEETKEVDFVIHFRDERKGRG